MHKTYLFSVTCPHCGTDHEKEFSAANLPPLPGALPNTHHFICCGHEIGFSVRRVIGGGK